MNWNARRSQFRELMDTNTCYYPGSVFDPISARIAEDLGFELGMFAGSVASMTVIGAPDIITLNQSEFADQAYRINRAGNLPLIVDADHGYGNAMNVKRTVEELETAGVAALSIEDTLLPRAFGSGGKTSLISIEEGVGKMIILGRTSAMSVTNTDDAIARALAYQEAGVDMLMMVGLKELDQLQALHAAVKIPVMLGGTTKELMNKTLLAEHGVRICLQGHKPFAAAVQAVYDTLKALRDGVDPADIKTAASKDLMNQVTRADDAESEMQRWL